MSDIRGPRPPSEEQFVEAGRESERSRLRRATLDEIATMHQRASLIGWSYVARAEGALWLALELELITRAEYHDLFNRLHYCPGHEPTQSRCVYCGAL
jgi:hypothetical protein